MRITSGTHKSRIIKAPGSIRPTLDNVRKAVFDILGEGVKGSRVLDLFAGSGALGIEALSRGAVSCTFVDNSRASIKAIKANLEGLGLAGAGRGPSESSVMYADSEAVIGRLAGDGAAFDIILMDPPYYKELAKKTLSLLGDCDILSETGVAVIEHSKHDGPLPPVCGGLKLLRTARYGDTLVSFYRKDQGKS
ncbi:MAG TPA: 16S rRNA (guanine(966)-N(2))-methyltransferase RsmD [Candidatus Omnitrophota bacterium]|mgnify:CR=1 FL=1|nr:16S rRNA (guanine(966)-N(2))-methyltransferase RsmD [Candidatus Omnitrophota bacterium]HOX09982.1 16S rRNA (guanine(966)-N(2))-methyltransferase RsmD [Candidatus Omnitrophota bacterium]HPN66116.1 16S rRNA (guanine(966)-N(2))-methyltransferase RsmD [Candidatus Omnitrophota bacterium]HRZ67745.1 16S rRNA (guanine(966)-N(2))-methyltransferase RsmD [Candidatus Omnitrophota bacterium]